MNCEFGKECYFLVRQIANCRIMNLVKKVIQRTKFLTNREFDQ